MNENEIVALLGLQSHQLNEIELQELVTVYNCHPLFLRLETKQEKDELFKELYRIGGVRFVLGMYSAALNVSSSQKTIANMQKELDKEKARLKEYIDQYNSGGN